MTKEEVIQTNSLTNKWVICPLTCAIAQVNMEKIYEITYRILPEEHPEILKRNYIYLDIYDTKEDAMRGRLRLIELEAMGLKQKLKEI